MPCVPFRPKLWGRSCTAKTSPPILNLTQMARSAPRARGRSSAGTLRAWCSRRTPAAPSRPAPQSLASPTGPAGPRSGGGRGRMPSCSPSQRRTWRACRGPRDSWRRRRCPWWPARPGRYGGLQLDPACDAEAGCGCAQVVRVTSSWTGSWRPSFPCSVSQCRCLHAGPGCRCPSPGGAGPHPCRGWRRGQHGSAAGACTGAEGGDHLLAQEHRFCQGQPNPARRSTACEAGSCCCWVCTLGRGPHFLLFAQPLASAGPGACYPGCASAGIASAHGNSRCCRRCADIHPAAGAGAGCGGGSGLH